MKLQSLKIYSLLSIVIMLASAANAQEPAIQNESSAEIKETESAEHGTESLVKKLRKSGISAIPDDNQTETMDDLQQLIDQLGSLTLPEPATESRQESAAKTVEQTVTVKKTVDASPVAGAEKVTISQLSPAEHILVLLEENPQSIVDPLGVAEALYSAGHRSNAAKLYQLAIDRMGSKEDHPDRDWAMLQRANCIRTQQPDDAGKIYQKLSDEYPNSTWNSAATAHRQVISWYKKNDPKTILAEYIIEDESEDVIVSESASEPNSL